MPYADAERDADREYADGHGHRQDPRPANFGGNFVDCDGGTNVDALVDMNSNGTSAPPAPKNTPALVGTPDPGRTPGTGTEPGHAVDHALIQLQILNTATCPGPTDPSWNGVADTELALTTGVAHARVTNRAACGQLLGFGCSTKTPYQVAIYGRQFNVASDCSNWSSATNAALASPVLVLNEFVSSTLSPSRSDLAIALRAKQQ